MSADEICNLNMSSKANRFVADFLFKPNHDCHRN